MKISIECLLMRGKPESTNTHRNQEKEFPNCLPTIGKLIEIPEMGA